MTAIARIRQVPILVMPGLFTLVCSAWDQSAALVRILRAYRRRDPADRGRIVPLERPLE